MDLKSIHQIFTNRILRIPSYQRGYSWGNNKPVSLDKDSELKNIKGQLMDLWNDIVNIPTNSWHYTGLLTLVEVDDQRYQWLPNFKQFEIVDGQQRITSILILVSVMIEFSEHLGIELGVRDGDAKFQYLYISKNNLNAYIFGYDDDNPSDKFFKKYILHVDEIQDDSRESVYTENLKKANTFFKFMVTNYISNISMFSNKEEGLQNLFNLVTGDLRFNEYILPPELDAYVVFETMNNRGKPLSELEKLKNRLMYLSDKFSFLNTDVSKEFCESQKNSLIDSINTAWITIYQALGANKLSPLPDNDFIKAHWIAYFDRYNRSESNAYATHLFNEYFTIEQVYDGSLSQSNILNYVKSLQRSSIIWNKLHNPGFFEQAESEFKEAVLGLHRVGFRASFKPLVLAALKQPNNEIFISLIKLLERYAFKVFYIADRQSNTGDSKLYRLASKVYHFKITAEDAYEEVSDYINYYYNFSSFKNQIKELFESGNKRGFYEWAGLHYFLYLYDQKLREENHASSLSSSLNWKDFNTKNTIEHIYPQSAVQSYEIFCDGNDTPERLKAYQRLQADWSAFSGYSMEERKRLCNSLGNLLAISHSDNASFSNNNFQHKVDQSNKGITYKNRGYRYDSMSAQIVAKNKDWTPELIKHRGLLILKELLNMLGEPEELLDKNELVKILGLDFLTESVGGNKLKPKAVHRHQPSN